MLSRTSLVVALGALLLTAPLTLGQTTRGDGLSGLASTSLPGPEDVLIPAGHPGAPALGNLDGWVDVHGDTMSGTLTMGENGVQFSNGLLTGSSLGSGLRFGGSQVCISGVPITGCGGSAPAWSSITGKPAGFADDVDNDILGGLLCAAGQVPKFSAGWGCGTDLDTTYTAGTGLQLAGTTFSADTSVLQARVSGSCAPGQFMRAVDGGGGVTCGTDANSGGDITGVTAGTGLMGGASSGDATLAVDSNVVQLRVIGTCIAADQSIKRVDPAGTVVCETDNYARQAVRDVAGVGFLNAACSNANAGGNSVALTVPSAGRVIVSGTIHVSIEHLAGTPDELQAMIGLTNTDCLVPSSLITEERWPAGLPPDPQYETTLPVFRYFDVAGAGTQTYFLNARMIIGVGLNDRALSSTLSAVFYPTGP